MLSDFDYEVLLLKDDNNEEYYVIRFLEEKYKYCSAVGNTIKEAFAEAEIVAEMLADIEKEETNG